MIFEFKIVNIEQSNESKALKIFKMLEVQFTVIKLHNNNNHTCLKRSDVILSWRIGITRWNNVTQALNWHSRLQ